MINILGDLLILTGINIILDAITTVSDFNTWERELAR